MTATLETTQTCSFSLELETIVKTARRYILEAQWRKAISLLQKSVTPHFPLDVVVAVLSGKSNFKVQDGCWTLVPQDPSDGEFQFFTNTRDWQLAGIMERDGEFYQPYAVIESYSSTDEDKVLARLEDSEDWSSISRYIQERSQSCMDNPQSDIVEFGINKYPVLFKRVQGPAFWIETFEDDPAAAYKAYCKQRQPDCYTSTGRNPCLPSEASFYRKAIVAGVLLGHPWDAPVVGDEAECLTELIRMRANFELAVDDLPENEDLIPFSKKGYQLNERYLHDELKAATNCLILQMNIRRQAAKAGGFFKLPIMEVDGTSSTIEVPYAPFIHWAMRSGGGAVPSEQLPPWECITPSGLKMIGDSRMHSDWWIGAGLNPDDAYDLEHPVHKASWQYALTLNRSRGMNCIKLAGKGKVTGPVVIPGPHESVPSGAIAIVSHAGVDYELAMISACKDGKGAVIAEVGGKLAHLAIVSREMNGRLLVVENALKEFKEGQLVTVDLDKGTVTVNGYSPVEDPEL